MNRSEAFNLLGVAAGASEEDIKKAYRKKAMEHHPDRGGDEETFKRVKQAYELLTGQVQPEQPQGGHPFNRPFGPGGPSIDDIFARAFGGGGGPFHFHFDTGGQRGERLYSVTFPITLKEAFDGCQKKVHVALVPGHIEEVEVPPGVVPGQVIKTVRLQKGDHPVTCQLAVSIDTGPEDVAWPNDISRMAVFNDGAGNIRRRQPVSAFTMMRGGWIKVPTLDGSEVEVRVPAGLEPGKFLKVKDRGYWANFSSGRRGDLLLQVIPLIPRIQDLTPEDVQQLREILTEVENRDSGA